MKRARILVFLSAAALAGCGGSGSHTTKTTSTKTAAVTTPSTSTTSTRSPSDCNAVGIDPTGMREGTCTHGGITWVIVDENRTLKLDTLWANLVSVRTSKTLASTTASGDFVIATVALINKLAAPQTFDQANTQQAGLILDGAVVKEAVGTERGADANSCLARNATPIQPGQILTCELVFDVPAKAAADLGKRGSGDLYLVNFGSDLSASVFPQTVGQIRLYQ